MTGRIWQVPSTAAQGTAPIEVLDSSLNIASFAEADDGELYVVDYQGGLYRIVDR